MEPAKTSSTSAADSLSEEIRSCWRQLPDKGLFFALLGAWLALFHFLGNSTFGYIPTNSLFYWMYNAYHEKSDVSDDAHGKMILFLVLGLFWWKRKELLAQPMRTWWPGVLLVLSALVLHILGYLVQQPRVSVVALFVGIYGLMGMVWGLRFLTASFFPFFLFAFMVPLGSLAEPVTFPLRILVSSLVQFISSDILGISVVRAGTQLFNSTSGYQYDVAAACSGLRSLIAIFLVSTTYGFVAFKTLGKRATMISAAVPLAVIGNAVRLLLIVLAAEIGGQEWGNFVHEDTFFSLIPYVPAFLGLFWLGRYLERKEKPETEPDAVVQQPTTI